MDKPIQSKNSLNINDKDNTNVNKRVNNLEETVNEADDKKSKDLSTILHQIEDDKEIT